MEQSNNTIMYNIKRYLKKKGYKCNALANKVGMTQQQFSHHIKQKKDLSLNLTIRLSEHLEMSLEKFIDNIKE